MPAAFLAALPLRQRAADRAAFGAASVALLAEIVLAVTGGYMSTLHLCGAEEVTATSDGRARTLKLLLVATSVLATREPAHAPPAPLPTHHGH